MSKPEEVKFDDPGAESPYIVLVPSINHGGVEYPEKSVVNLTPAIAQLYGQSVKPATAN